MLEAMQKPASFIETCLSEIGNALIDAVGRAGLHLRPDTLTKTAAARLRAAMHLIESLLRRTLVLLAAETDIGPVAPARTSRPGTQGQRPRAGYQFCYVPEYRYDGAWLDEVHGRPGRAAAGAIRIAPFLHRWRTLTALIENPERAARRMAHALRRSARAGNPKPICPPHQARHRLSAELGLIAGLLPVRVNCALDAWFDSS